MVYVVKNEYGVVYVFPGATLPNTDETCKSGGWFVVEWLDGEHEVDSIVEGPFKTQRKAQKRASKLEGRAFHKHGNNGVTQEPKSQVKFQSYQSIGQLIDERDEPIDITDRFDTKLQILLGAADRLGLDIEDIGQRFGLGEWGSIGAKIDEEEKKREVEQIQMSSPELEEQASEKYLFMAVLAGHPKFVGIVSGHARSVDEFIMLIAQHDDARRISDSTIEFSKHGVVSGIPGPSWIVATKIKQFTREPYGLRSVRIFNGVPSRR